MAWSSAVSVAGSVTPAPGLSQLTMPSPRKSATVVATSK
jgi:hypothetical protein